MNEPNVLSRRAFLAVSAAALPLAAAASGPVPVGLEMFSVREDLKNDFEGTVDAVGKMGYQCVEFYATYFDWTPERARQVRKQIEGLGMRCPSTHNGMKSFSGDGLKKAAELNHILGSKYVVLAHPGTVAGLDDWKRVADTLNQANQSLEGDGMHSGYHNHDLEWKLVDGQKPIEFIAAHTDRSIMLQLDVGTCLETGNDPVAWVNKNPGRIRSFHMKDWSPDKKYRVLFGEGSAPWKQIIQAAESTGGVEYYLIEQEGSDYSERETAERCLENWRKLRQSI